MQFLRKIKNSIFSLIILIFLVISFFVFKSSLEKEKNYESIIGFFEVLDEKNKTINLQPEIRIYNEPEMATSEASIKTSLFNDRFITINIIKDQNFFNVRYQHKPFMIWIWISTLIIMLGGMFAIFRKNKEVNI